MYIQGFLPNNCKQVDKAVSSIADHLVRLYVTNYMNNGFTLIRVMTQGEVTGIELNHK
jgi:hypothetical protein